MIIEIKDNKTEYKNAGIVASLFRGVLAMEEPFDQEKEHFWVLGVNQNNTLKYLDLVSLGTLNTGLAHPREIYRTAILKGVAAIIICHNHPSGNINPSDDDIKLTKNLKEAGKIIGINLLDHVIITTQNHYSFTDSGII